MTSVLRLGHRPERDKRLSTHVCLTARALGAKEVYFPELDPRVESSVVGVTDRFGSDFNIKEAKNWRKLVQEWDGDVVHLTMYGVDIDEFYHEQDPKDPLIIVGSQKIPREVYEMADHNVSVGNQPHSEVAALAIFMDRYNGRNIPQLSDGKMAVLPSEKGKRVINYDKIPSAELCYRLMHERGMDQGLFMHTMAVLQRTLELYDVHGGDLRLLMAGALLHDIGRTVTHGVEHGVESGKIVEEMGWDDELVNIVERHIGGGITKKEAKEQGLPAKDYLPVTLEERIICHADNTAGGIERFEDMVKRTREAGFSASAERMLKLRNELG